MDVVRGPEFHAGCTAGSWSPHVSTTSVRDPLRDRGCRGVPGIPFRLHKPGSGFPDGIRTSTRDSIRCPGCRTGPGWPSGATFGLPDLVRAPELHVGFNAGSDACLRIPSPTRSCICCHTVQSMIPQASMSARDPYVILDTGYRAGPGCPHVGSNAGYEAPCGIKSYMHVSYAGPVTP